MSIGGPILKNKLFYFFNGELQRRNNPIISSNISSTLFSPAGVPTGAVDKVTGCGGSSFAVKASAAQCQTAINYLITRVEPQLVPRTVDENLLFGKVDYQINDRNRLTSEMNYLDFRSPNGIQTQGVLTNGSAIGNNANTTVFDRTEKLGLITIVAANAVNELRFGIFKDRQFDPASTSLFPAATGPASYSISSGSLSNIGVATAYPRLHPSELRFQLSDSYAWTIGRHAFKFGADWSHTERLRSPARQPIRHLHLFQHQCVRARFQQSGKRKKLEQLFADLRQSAVGWQHAGFRAVRAGRNPRDAKVDDQSGPAH